jgi:hypothetical protein
MNALSEFGELLVAISLKGGQVGCEHLFPPLLFCVLQELLVAVEDFDGVEPY